MRRLESMLFWMAVIGWAGLLGLVAFALFGVPTPDTYGFGVAAAQPAETAKPGQVDGAGNFTIVTEVLQSSRCVNCHPKGHRPLDPDGTGFHAMNISRTTLDNGVQCSTCHKEQNSEFVGVAGGPPGAPHWGLPPQDTPMIFEGRSERELCQQLNQRRATGGRNLAALLKHVSHDPLVLWAWNPGGDREPPPHSHEKFVAAFQAWVDSGGSCANTATSN